MPHALIKFTIEDRDKWRAAFAEAAALRKSHGSMGVHAFVQAGEPNQVVILGEFEDLDRARQLFQSAEFREVTKKAGVIGAPEVTFLNEVVKLPA